MLNNLSNSSNLDYHADRTSLSSSNLKLIRKDVHQFYTEWVLGHKLQETKPAFDEGSYVHTLCLEPHKAATDYAIFPGLRKAGKEWEYFQIDNPGKILLSVAQEARCLKCFDAFSSHPTASGLIRNGHAEFTIVQEWMGVSLKMRADYINIDEGYIVDIKTTSHASDLDTFKFVVEDYSYDLSGALYCQLAEKQYNKHFDFYFIVLSKTEETCDVYKMGDRTRQKGNEKCIQAIQLYKRCKASNNWTTEYTKEAKGVGEYEILEV